MSQYPSVRTIREALHAATRTTGVDPLALEALRFDVVGRLDEMRRSMDRAFDFSAKGLVSEAASVVTDFPDLAREADALLETALVDPHLAPRWRAVVGSVIPDAQLPRRDEIDRLAGIAMRAEALRPLLDALRLCALRREPIQVRMRILRKLRNEDERNRLWLDQIEALENEWIRSMSELRHRTATREEIDEALIALETHEWVASVPRGLREELFAKVMPLRGEEAGGRYERLAEEIHQAAARMDRAEVLRLEQAWATVNQETGRMPAEELERAVAPAFAWLTRIEEEEVAQCAFDAQVDRLEQLLNESRGVSEVEAQVATVRDAGREAPGGLLERALRYAQTARERAQHRHRLVLAASLLGALVVIAIGAIALSLHAAQQERATLLAALRDAVTAKDAARLAPLVAEIRDEAAEPNPELASMLAEADAVLSARVTRTAEIRALLASAQKELAGVLSRARLNALKQALALAITDAEAADRSPAQRVEAQCVTAIGAADAAALEVAKKSVETVETALLNWPLPDGWRDTEILDDGHWSAYIAVLDTQRRHLQEATAQIDGHEESASRIELKRDFVEKRLAEAKSRAEALRAAKSDLSDDRLLAPVTSEKQFIARVDAVVKAHSPVLARMHRLGNFETALDCVNAYQAMEVWRSKIRPMLAAALGSNLAVTPSPEVAGRVATEILGFIAAHPDAPMREILIRLANDLDPNSGSILWSPQQVARGLASEHIAGIEEVPVQGGRRFYRRPPTEANPSVTLKSPMTRALTTLADLSTDPERLRSMLAVQSAEVEAKAFANPISVAWRRAEDSLASASSHEVLPAMFVLVDEILSDRGSDPLLRFCALESAIATLVDSGHAQGNLAAALALWQNRCRDAASNAHLSDWVAAGYDEAAANWQKPRGEANVAIAKFPAIASLREEVERESRRLGDALSALVPVGVAGARGAEDAAPRAARVSGTPSDLFMLAQRGAEWSIVPVRVENGRLVAAPSGVPLGPALIYRRNRT